MKLYQQLIGVVFGVASIGIIATGIFSLQNSKHIADIDASPVTLIEGSNFNIQEGTYDNMLTVYNDEYTLTTEIITGINFELTHITDNFLIKMVIGENHTDWFTINNDDTITYIGGPAFSIDSSIVFEFEKSVLDNSSLLLIGLIPVITIGGLITYMIVKKND